MKAYYIDEALNEKETKEVEEYLKDLGGVADVNLEFKRIPYVFPADGNTVKNDEMVVKFRSHLKNAGVKNGDVCMLIMPKDGIRWAILMQLAFENITGLLPLVVQPWGYENKTLVRRESLFVTNMSLVLND